MPGMPKGPKAIPVPGKQMRCCVAKGPRKLSANTKTDGLTDAGVTLTTFVDGQWPMLFLQMNLRQYLFKTTTKAAGNVVVSDGDLAPYSLAYMCSK